MDSPQDSLELLFNTCLISFLKNVFVVTLLDRLGIVPVRIDLVRLVYLFIKIRIASRNLLKKLKRRKQRHVCSHETAGRFLLTFSSHMKVEVFVSN